MDGNQVKNAVDVGIGVGGLTSSEWLQWVHAMSDMAAAMAAVGGAILVTLRIAIAYRDWSEGKKVKVKEKNDECGS